jgi:hypothetical protein
MKILGVSILCFLLFSCGQQPMEKAALDLPTAQPVSTTGRVVATRAFTVITNISEPLDFTQFVPCADEGAGEDVHLTGTLHTVIRTTINSNKVGIKTLSNPQGVSGVGLTTGDKYRGTGVTQETSNEHTGGLPETETFINNFRILGPGRGNNLLVHENAHFTVNANGTVTSFIDNFSIECK